MKDSRLYLDSLKQALKDWPPIWSSNDASLKLCKEWNADWEDSIMTQLDLYKQGRGRLQTN